MQRAPTQAGDAYRDRRIGAVVAIAPAVVRALTATNARAAAARIPGAQLLIVAGGGTTPSSP